ncbi:MULTISPECIES: hypothetical protein [unclassified Mycobacterium]|uniref:hypothetical protein n=1 Tax=unclassified Mycobacterium TaxID=2642494 RepID=UPI001E2E05C2|nr:MULTISPECIES: hypothetical protein [unclassified Mycobacterium]
MTTSESNTDHEFVNIAEDIDPAHRPVDVGLRQSGDPLRQMLASFGQFVSASELLRWIVDEKFRDDGQ